MNWKPGVLVGGLILGYISPCYAVTEQLVYCGQLEQVNAVAKTVLVSSRTFHLYPVEAGAPQLARLQPLMGQRICFPVIMDQSTARMNLQQLTVDARSIR